MTDADLAGRVPSAAAMAAQVAALLAFVVLLAPACAAQRYAPAEGISVWGAAGLGYMLKPMFSGVSANAGVAGERLAIAIGYDRAEEFWAGATMNALSLRPGLRTDIATIQFHSYAGPAVVWGEREYRSGGPSGERYTTVGLAVDVSALVDIGAGFRIGVESRANLNSVQSTLGFGPAVRLTFAGRANP